MAGWDEPLVAVPTPLGFASHVLCGAHDPDLTRTVKGGQGYRVALQPFGPSIHTDTRTKFAKLLSPRHQLDPLHPFHLAHFTLTSCWYRASRSFLSLCSACRCFSHSLSPTRQPLVASRALIHHGRCPSPAQPSNCPCSTCATLLQQHSPSPSCRRLTKILSAYSCLHQTSHLARQNFSCRIGRS